MVRIGYTGKTKRKLFLYTVIEEEVTKPGYKMDPLIRIIAGEKKEILMRLPGRSIRSLTSFKSSHDDQARK